MKEGVELDGTPPPAVSVLNKEGACEVTARLDRILLVENAQRL